MRLRRAGSAILLVLFGLCTVTNANDDQIARELAEQLRVAKTSQDLNGFRIGVKVENGVVWMKGQVNDTSQREHALGLARRIEGVKLVVNDLKLAGEAKPQPTESEPTPAIQQVAAQTPMPAVASVPTTTTAAPTPAPMAPPTRSTMAQPVQQTTPAPQPRLAAMPAAQRPVVQSNVPRPVRNDGYHARPVQHVQGSVSCPSGGCNSMNYGSGMGAPTPAMSYGGGYGGSFGDGGVTYESPDCPSGGCGSMNYGAGMGAPMPEMSYGYESAGYPSGGCDSVNYGSGMGTPMPEMSYGGGYGGSFGGVGGGGGVTYESPQLPGHAWPSYASYPNYGAVTYPKQYSPMAWPYIGPFYPYPQVPMGWRKVSLEWDDGWWFLDFKSK